MNPEYRSRSLIAFFLGTKAATLEKNDPEIVRIVGRRAYRDLNRTLHGIGTHPEADNLRERTYEALTDFVAGLEHVDTAKEFDKRHQAWCVATKRRFNESTHPERPEFTFHYGQAQKWLNMTLKYLAVLDHKPVAHTYEFMHVPLDQIIYTQAQQIDVDRPKGTKWSRLSGEQYRDYQKQLKHQIKSTFGNDRIPLDWESQVWIDRASTTVD